jgi:mycothiol system anti-sigma-R factor
MITPPSDGSTASLTCSAVLERIFEFLGGELTPEVDARIREHLAICGSCHPEFEHGRVFLAFLARHAQIERAPVELRMRILAELIEEEAARLRR